MHFDKLGPSQRSLKKNRKSNFNYNITEHCEPIDQVTQNSGSSKEPTRRSARSTTGKHSNPHRLPKSVVRSQTVTKNFQELSQAVVSLGATLASKVQYPQRYFLQVYPIISCVNLILSCVYAVLSCVYPSLSFVNPIMFFRL